jgi:zinc transport system ATP-binding protein
MNQTEHPLIQTHDLRFSVNDQVIVDDVSLSLSANKIVTLIGPNGAGKTTLVKLILGLLKPTAGQIIRQSGLRIGYMPQKIQIDSSLPLSVDRFLKLAPKSSFTVTEIAELTRIGHLLSQPIYRLSGGETQRVLLARALLQKPELLVLDEPVQGVDVVGQRELYQLICQIRDELQCGVLMISHDLHLVMASTDTVVCLDKHVCCHGHPETVTSNPAYLDLFGQHQTTGVVGYTHHHNHVHDESGTDHGKCSHGDQPNA